MCCLVSLHKIALSPLNRGGDYFFMLYTGVVPVYAGSAEDLRQWGGV